MFDPYEQWLGIGKNQRPVTCYQLLGVSPGEADPKKIEKAAERAAAKVHRHREGEHAPVCTRVLKEIEQAKSVLLDPAKRKAYDAKLRAKSGAAADTVEKTPAASDTTTDAAAKTPLPEASAIKDDPDKPRKRRKSKDEVKPKKSGALWIIVGGVVLLLVLAGGGVGAYFAFNVPGAPTQMVSNPPTQPKLEPTKPEPTKPEPPKPEPPKPKDQPKPKDPPKPAPPKPTPPKPTPPKPAPPQVVKQPAPEEAALAKAEAALKEAWKTDYSRTKPEERATLSGKFLTPGREDRKDAAAWFVMLREARDLAVVAGKPRLAMEAIDEIDKWFVIDALDMKMKALETLSKDKGETTQLAAVRVCQHMLEHAYTAENYELGERLLKIADEIVAQAKGSRIGDIVRQLRSEHAQYHREFQAVSAARSTLKQNPNDPRANEDVGIYTCFFQGDWEQGLPHLAKGLGNDLTALAKLDRSQPADVAMQLKVADGWWDLVQAQKERAQRNLLKRAKALYAKAGPNTAGEERQRVVERIHEAQEKEYARIHRLIPGSYFGRDAESRTLLLREGGGNVHSEEAIQRGLEWLARHQSPNGQWHTDFKCKCTEPGAKHDIAATAFGLLPFLGAGHTHKQGRYANTVARGLSYLLSKQNAQKGNFHDNGYENALASIAVIECFGLTKDPALQLPALAATQYIVQAQARDGSWHYSAGAEKGDTSVAGWQFTALKAAAYAQLGVPQQTFDYLSAFLDSVADSGGLGYGYNSRNANPSTSAAGILCRQFLSWGPDHPALKKEIDHLLRSQNYPKKENFNTYLMFYMTQVAHHLGGEYWEKWNNSVRDLLIELQDKGDDPKQAHQKGSWSPKTDPYKAQGGRLMTSALAIISLEAYYYHVPLYGYGKSVLED